jgi:hypothetical protein
MKTKPSGSTSQPSQHKSVDVIELLNNVEFTPDNVVDAAAVNPVLFVRAISYRLECMQKKSRLEMDHKRICAEVELKTRHKASENGEKITENHIKSILTLDKTVSAAASALETAETFDEYSKLIVEVFRMRRDCLRIVSDMTRQELSLSGRAFDSETESMRATREKLHDRFPGSQED